MDERIFTTEARRIVPVQSGQGGTVYVQPTQHTVERLPFAVGILLFMGGFYWGILVAITALVAWVWLV